MTDLEGALGTAYVAEVDLTMTRQAGDLAERHALRGYDAVHLATALALKDPDLVFVTWDRDLSAAARAAGRAVAPSFA